MIRQTHTYVTLEVSAAAYDEIGQKLRDVDYDHCFNNDGEIDMHGLALVRQAPSDGQIPVLREGPIIAIPMFSVKPEWIFDIRGEPINQFVVVPSAPVECNMGCVPEPIELPHHADWRKTMTTARTLDLTCNCGQTNCCWPRYDNCGND